MPSPLPTLLLWSNPAGDRNLPDLRAVARVSLGPCSTPYRFVKPLSLHTYADWLWFQTSIGLGGEPSHTCSSNPEKVLVIEVDSFPEIASQVIGLVPSL